MTCAILLTGEPCPRSHMCGSDHWADRLDGPVTMKEEAGANAYEDDQ